MNVRVSVSAIDSWRYWAAQEDSEIENLLSQLRGETPQSEPMRVGSALHLALEQAQSGTFVSLEANGYSFFVQPGLEITLPEIRELKMECEYVLSPLLTITLVGKVDAMYGKTVYDHKTTRRFDAEKLTDTYQWRHYLNMARADCFVWNVFTLQDSTLDPTEYTISDLQIVAQYRYPGLEEDCLRNMRDFAEFLGLATMRAPADSCTLQALLKANLMKAI